MDFNFAFFSSIDPYSLLLDAIVIMPPRVLDADSSPSFFIATGDANGESAAEDFCFTDPRPFLNWTDDVEDDGEDAARLLPVFLAEAVPTENEGDSTTVIDDALADVVSPPALEMGRLGDSGGLLPPPAPPSAAAAAATRASYHAFAFAFASAFISVLLFLAVLPLPPPAPPPSPAVEAGKSSAFRFFGGIEDKIEGK